MGYDSMIQKSLDKIEGSLPEKISIRELADSACFSRYHFQRLFHAYVGNSVMEYIKQRRLSLAAQELCETNATVLEIALKYGYRSHESFTRAFKSYHGVTPAECRKYHIYHPFEKADVVQERNMKRGSLAKITEDTARHLHNFLVSLKKTAEAIREVCWEPSETLAGELDALAGQIANTCALIQEPPGSGDNALYIEINNRFALIDVLDNVVFQTHFINFCVQVETARSGYMGQEICLLCKQLTQIADERRNQIYDIFKELSDLIYDAIWQECFTHLNRMIQSSNTAAKEIKEAPLSNGDALQDIARAMALQTEKLDNIKQRDRGLLQKQAGKTIAAASDGAMLLRLMEFQLNLWPVSEGSREQKTLRRLRCNMERTVENMQQAFDAFQGLGKLTSQKPSLEIPAEKVIEDILFQKTLLCFALDGEPARLNGKITPDQLHQLKQLCRQIHGIFEALEASEGIGVQQRVRQCGQQLEAASIGLEQMGAGLNGHGKCLLLMGSEFGILARHLLTISFD